MSKKDYDFQALSQRLKNTLNLETPPVAMLLSPKIPQNVEKHEGKMKWCEFLEEARLKGKTFYTTLENQTCLNGNYYLGLTKAFPGHLAGEWLSGKYPDEGRRIFKSPMSVKRALNKYWKILPETIKSISYSPLGECPFDPETGGLIVLIICNPKQAMYLIRGYTFENGGIVYGATMPSTCSSVVSRAYLTGEVSPSLGCFGGRTFIKIKTEEMFVGIPIELLTDIVKNLEDLLEGRPDLVDILNEGVGKFHEATIEEKTVQRAGWKQ